MFCNPLVSRKWAVAFVNVSNQNTNAQIVVSSIVRWTAGKNIERLNVNPCRYQKVQWRKLAKRIRRNMNIRQKTLFPWTVGWSGKLHGEKGMESAAFYNENTKKGNSNTKSLAYRSLVRPILEYGAACWDPYREGQVRALDRAWPTGPLCDQY